MDRETAPVKSGLLVQVAAGDAFSIVVTVDGKVFTWGANDQGQLGLGDLRDRHVPTQVKVRCPLHPHPRSLLYARTTVRSERQA